MAGELVSEMHKQIKCVVVSKVICLSRKLSLTSLLHKMNLPVAPYVCIIVLMLFVYLNCTLCNLTFFVQVSETYYM